MRDKFVDYLLRFVGSHYRWGGNGVQGFDCSGFVCEGLRAFGKIYTDMGAGVILDTFKANVTSNPQRGTLVFFGAQNAISHVGVCLGDGTMLEAGGGGRNTTTIEAAEKLGAMVRIRPIKNRRDFVCYADPFMQP